ncbi:hypothetical protein [uncultured Winogradskyella sp.]|uniref:hypothetical protein n=1 Tax=uncultured Winogradskyella sp. TaxID=395353 RepID=UPI0026320D57|nr:hypothetical protein [uncultured Winogradskyella sp.]
MAAKNRNNTTRSKNSNNNNSKNTRSNNRRSSGSKNPTGRNFTKPNHSYEHSSSDNNGSNEYDSESYNNSSHYPSKEDTNSSNYNDNGYDSGSNNNSKEHNQYRNEEPINDPPYDDYDSNYSNGKDSVNNNSNYSENNSHEREDDNNSEVISKQRNGGSEESNSTDDIYGDGSNYEYNDVDTSENETSNNNTDSNYRENNIIPMGKGMFVENLRGAEPTAEGFANRAQQNGITWIAFKGATQDVRGITQGDQNESQRITQDYIETFKNNVDNAKVYVWGWPTANSNARQYRLFIDRMIRKVEWVNGDGIILDIEGPIRGVRATGWNRGDNTRNMRILMDYALEQAHQRNMTVAVSSFGTAVRGFPWSEMSRADFGIPQLYSPLNEIFDSSGSVKQTHRNYIRRGVELWQDDTRGFNNKIVVASATMTRGRKTATHVRALLEITAPHLTNQSIIWWVWHGTRNRRAPMSDAKWDVIRSFNF